MSQEAEEKMMMQHRFEIENGNKYQVLDVLGTGGFGIVLRARNKTNGEEVAIKAQERQSMAFNTNPVQREERQKRAFREIFHHRQLTGHPCIIDFKEVFLTKSYLCIVMELAQGDNLFKYIVDCHSQLRDLSEDEARAWFQQLILSQKFCHSKHIVNRDIKLENTLRVCGQKSGWWGILNRLNPRDKSFWYLKICDFGYSKNMERNSLPKSRIGSLPYACPEVLYLQENQTCDGYKMDVWACGVTLFILLAAVYPFDPVLHQEDFYPRVKNGYFRFPAKCKASNVARELVTRMLDPNPETRISLEDVIQHPWFQVNLPRDWDKSFEQDVALKQQNLQSEQEIKSIVDEVFKRAQSTSVEDDLEANIDMFLNSDIIQ